MGVVMSIYKKKNRRKGKRRNDMGYEELIEEKVWKKE